MPLLAGLFAWVVGAAIFFRVPLLSGFVMTTGNGGDGRLIVYLHEHLYRWLQGRALLDAPGIYFPEAHALGYSDAFLLDLPGYALFRLAGADPFLAEEALLVVLSLLCFWSVWYLLRRDAGVGSGVAVGAALLATFPNDLFLKANSGHLNSFALYYIPPILCLAAPSFRGLPRISAGAAVRLLLAGLLYGLLFATCFYVAWMFALTLVIGALSAVLMDRRQARAWIAANRKGLLAALGLAGGGLLVGCIPCILIYLPALQEQHGRSFESYLGFAPSPYDVINASSWNLFWGRLLDLVLTPGRAGAVERALAATPGMTLILIAGFVIARRRACTTRPGADRAIRFTAVALAVLGVSWLLTLHIGSASLFWVLRELVPGAAAIRVGGRIQMLVNLWIVAALAMMLAGGFPSVPVSARRRRMLAAAILAFCLAEQLNLIQGGTPRSKTLAMLADVPSPPADCASFLVAAGDRRVGNWDHNNAAWISLRTGLPTLNGASGWSPPGWRLDDPSLGYLDAARAWIAARKPPGQVCLYDENRRLWSPFARGG